MNAAALALLSAVHAAGGTITANEGRLKVNTPAPLPADLLERLRTAKPDLIALLTAAPANHAGIDPAEYEERAALIEYGAGVPREWAEGFARLCVMPRPDAIAEARWDRLVNDGGLFIDKWARQAAALGWDTASVFGVHPFAPAERWDYAGLCWMLDGAAIIAITASTATIECRGARQSVTRRLPEPGCIPVWELAP